MSDSKPQLSKEELEERATYEQLEELECQLEDVDAEITAKQALLTAPIQQKLTQLVPKIPSFWALVFEQAPPEIDSYLQPSDSAIFATALKHVSVTRFEMPSNASASSSGLSSFGEPRSFSIRFEFGPNEYFEDSVLEKKFYFRKAKDGYAGRISEPVKIHWKPGKDLTEGLTDAAYELYQAQLAHVQKNGGKWGVYGKKKTDALPTLEIPQFKAIVDKVETSTEGALSFFTWFGYRGKYISDEEHKQAVAEEQGRREKVRKGEPLPDDDDEDDDEMNDDDETPDFFDAEVFFQGEDVAIAIADDLFPNAIRYFMDSQDADDLSEGDFEDMDEDEEDDEEDEDDEDDDDDGDVNMEEIRKLAKKKSVAAKKGKSAK